MAIRTTSAPLPAADLPVRGVNLRPGALADQLDDRPTLIVFLRHLGCIFCRELVGDVEREATRTPGFPIPLYVVQADVGGWTRVFSRRHPAARAVCDVDAALFRAFGVERGGVREMFGAPVVACGVRAAAKGHVVGRPVGDVRTLPTLVLVRDGRVVAEHRGRHAGDHPDLARLAA